MATSEGLTSRWPEIDWPSRPTLKSRWLSFQVCWSLENLPACSRWASAMPFSMRERTSCWVSLWGMVMEMVFAMGVVREAIRLVLTARLGIVADIAKTLS